MVELLWNYCEPCVAVPPSKRTKPDNEKVLERQVVNCACAWLGVLWLLAAIYLVILLSDGCWTALELWVCHEWILSAAQCSCTGVVQSWVMEVMIYPFSLPTCTLPRIYCLTPGPGYQRLATRRCFPNLLDFLD